MDMCIACSMPLTSDNEIGATVEEGKVCIHCSTEDGKVKSCEEVFEGGVGFFLSKIGDDRELAERLVRATMTSLPYWEKRPCDCLNGSIASDEEMGAALEKLRE